jgi:hypothetical protein
VADDDLLEPEEASEETVSDELGIEGEGVTEEMSVEEGAEETVAEVEGEAEVEEDLGEAPAEEEAEDAGYVPAAAELGPPPKATSNVYTVMLIVAFLLFGTTIYLVGAELKDFYGWKCFGMMK